MHRIHKIILSTAVLGFVGVMSPGAAAAAVVVKNLEASVAVGDQSLLVVGLAIGQVRVVPGTGTRVEVEAEIRCSRFNRRCRRQADAVSLVLEARTAGIDLDIRGYSRRNIGGAPQIDLVIYMPSSLDFEIDLGVGGVEIDGRAGVAGIDVDLGVGEVDLRLPRADVASVRLEVGVGTARIGPDHLHRRRSGFLVFGNEVSWRAGRGEAEVRVDLGVGAAEVILE